MAKEAAQQEAQGSAHLVTLSEVKDLLEREQSGRQDLSYEQKLALDHATHFVRLPAERARELADKLLALGGRVNEYYAHRLADILPTHADDVKAVFARDRSAPEDAEIERILTTVRDYV